MNDPFAPWEVDFVGASYLEWHIFPVAWGDWGEFAFGGDGLTITADSNPVGFMVADSSPTSGNAYGLYSATFSMPATEGLTAYVTLWPSNNVFPGAEIDLGEQLGAGQGFVTVHWRASDGTNQYQAYFPNVSFATPTTVSVDWEPTGITYYVNGQEVVSFPAGGSVPIPKDAADGGSNESLGVGDTGSPGSQITVYKMSYTPSATALAQAAAEPAPVPIDTATTVGTAAPTFATEGSSGATTPQQLLTYPGIDILLGGAAADTFYIDAISGDGWAEIDNFHAGDVASILGFVPGMSTLAWTTATDMAGKAGATALVSLAGNGRIDERVTFAGATLASAESWTTSYGFSSGGVSELNLKA